VDILGNIKMKGVNNVLNVVLMLGAGEITCEKISFLGDMMVLGIADDNEIQVPKSYVDKILIL